MRIELLGADGMLRERVAGALRVSPAVESCELGTLEAPGGRGGGQPAPDAAVVLAAGAHWSGAAPDPGPLLRWLEPLRSGLSRFVLVSSTRAIEPGFWHRGLVPESELDPARARHPCARGWRSLERSVQRSFEGTPCRVAILRAAPVLLAEEGPGALAPLVFGRSAVPLGFDPPLQFLDAGDLAGAVRLALERGASGVFHLAPAGAVTLRGALRLAGARTVSLPWSLLRVIRGPQVDYLRNAWTVSGPRAAAELGFVAGRSSAQVAAALSTGSAPTGPARSGPPIVEDPHGFDPDFVERLGRGLFGFLHDRYFRIEVTGLEHVPRKGPVVLSGPHRGVVPFDAMMLLHLLGRECGRYPRFLIDPGLLKFPGVSRLISRLGGVIACLENADWLLDRGDIAGVLPEGTPGAFGLVRDAHRIGDFHRNQFVRMALRHRAPILPFVTIGPAEVLPVVAKLESRWWKSYAGWPWIPIPASPIPLPIKWHTRFLAPLAVHEEYGPGAENDQAVLDAVGERVRALLQRELNAMLARRRSRFRGALAQADEVPG